VTATLRIAGPADALLIADHRDAMFTDAGTPAADIRKASGMYRDWLAGALAADTYFGWLAEVDDQVVGSIGLWLLPWPWHPNHPTTGIRGYITNMWVEPSHRRQGISRMMMDAAVTEARARGVTWMMLHATDAGRAAYATMGWQQSNEMVLKLA
jgi:GNAT superfamily N-acetyltransferase